MENKTVDEKLANVLNGLILHEGKNNYDFIEGNIDAMGAGEKQCILVKNAITEIKEVFAKERRINELQGKIDHHCDGCEHIAYRSRESCGTCFDKPKQYKSELKKIKG